MKTFITVILIITAVCYGWQKAAELIESYLLHQESLPESGATIM